MVISFFNPGFIYAAEQRGVIRDIKQIINETIFLFNTFNLEFLNVFKNDFMILCGIILFLYILIYISLRKGNGKYLKKVLTFIPIILVSAFLFYYTLILVGVQPERGALAELTHTDLVLEMKIFLTFIIYVELGFLSKNSKAFYSFIFIYIILIFNN